MLHVLVVDDSKVMREMIVASVRSLPETSFSQAENGLEALEQLVLTPFDLAVLDLDMPGLGGLEVLEFVRAHDTLRALPILVVTSRPDADSRARVLDAGGTRFLAKPFEPQALLSEVRALLAGQAGPP